MRIRFACLALLTSCGLIMACGGGEPGPDPVASGTLALDGNQVVAVDVDAQTVTPVGQPIPSALMSARLFSSLDNRRVMISGSTGSTGTTALYVFRGGTWEEVVANATQVFTTVDLRFYGYRRDAAAAEPGTFLFTADGTLVFETDDPSLRVTSALDGSRAFLRDGFDLVILTPEGAETRFDPMLLTDWRPRLATGSRVLLGPSDIGSWYSLDGVMGESILGQGAGVGYLLEEDTGRLTYARETEDVEVATTLPPDATRFLTSDPSQVLVDDRDSMRVLSPDGTLVATITPAVYDGTPPAGAPMPESVRLGDVAAAIPNAGVFVAEQIAMGGAEAFATIVRFGVDAGGVTEDVVGVIPSTGSGDPLGDRPDARVVTWAEGTDVHYVDPLTGETGAFPGLSGPVSWARYPGGRGHRLPGD